MSSDHGPGAPSFGDLFEDPDSPAGLTPEPSVPSVPVDPAPTPAATTDDDRAAHDLDHESAEASHLVAGFETADEEAAAVEVAPFEAAPFEVAAAEAAPVEVAAAEVGPVVVAAATASTSRAPWDGTIDPAVSSAPAPRVDTGRLYRSAGAEGPATLDAIPAIDPTRAPAREPQTADAPAVVRPADRGLTYSGVVVVVGASTVLVAVAEALLRHDIGWMTGLALLVSSVYAALVVRVADVWAAVVIPPLAFLVALLTAGQLTVLGKSGSVLVREGAMLFVALATNAPWILGTTLITLAIVLVRRRRARPGAAVSA